MRGIFGDPKARIVRLLRGERNGLWIVWTEAANLFRPQDPSSAQTSLVATPGCIWRSRSGAYIAGAAAP